MDFWDFQSCVKQNGCFLSYDYNLLEVICLLEKTLPKLKEPEQNGELLCKIYLQMFQIMIYGALHFLINQWWFFYTVPSTSWELFHYFLIIIRLKKFLFLTLSLNLFWRNFPVPCNYQTHIKSASIVHPLHFWLSGAETEFSSMSVACSRRKA